MLVFGTFGLKEAVKKVKTMANRRKQGKHLSKVSTVVRNSIKKNYSRGGRPKWQKRKKDYAWPILDKTGTKRDVEESSTYSAWIPQGNEMVLEIYSTEYGKYHQEGCGNLPVRESVKLQQDEILKIREILVNG